MAASGAKRPFTPTRRLLRFREANPEGRQSVHDADAGHVLGEEPHRLGLPAAPADDAGLIRYGDLDGKDRSGSEIGRHRRSRRQVSVDPLAERAVVPARLVGPLGAPASAMPPMASLKARLSIEPLIVSEAE